MREHSGIAGRFVLAARLAAALLRPSPRLAAVQRAIASAYPDVARMSPNDLEERLAGPTPPLLLDVREPREAAVSLIAGARLVSPSADARTLVATLGPEIGGRSVVFYCAVGLRSARLAARFAGELQAAGAGDVLNLDGGIFRWHREGRPLVTLRGDATAKVHPFSAVWGRLLAASPPQGTAGSDE